MIKAVLTDIEGTTSAIAFVHETLFPYAREHMAEFVRQHNSEPEVRVQLDAIDELVGESVSVDRAIDILCQWIEEDRKVTPLKALQGMIWQQGYSRGELTGHVYADAVDALRAWHDADLRLYIYSSGSVQAQQLIFGHTAYGDLTSLFSGYFDTRVGHKREASSYSVIAGEMQLPSEQILFLSDIEEELDAAAAAGMLTTQLVRPGEGQAGSRHPLATDFSQVQLVRPE